MNHPYLLAALFLVPIPFAFRLAPRIRVRLEIRKRRARTDDLLADVIGKDWRTRRFP